MLLRDAGHIVFALPSTEARRCMRADTLPVSAERFTLKTLELELLFSGASRGWDNSRERVDSCACNARRFTLKALLSNWAVVKDGRGLGFDRSSVRGRALYRRAPSLTCVGSLRASL